MQDHGLPCAALLRIHLDACDAMAICAVQMSRGTKEIKSGDTLARLWSRCMFHVKHTLTARGIPHRLNDVSVTKSCDSRLYFL